MLCLFLRAGPERLAVPAAAVAEVTPAVPLHPVVGADPRVAGAFRFRGTVTPVLDLCRLATGDGCPTRLSTRIVVVRRAGDPRPVGLLVERVLDLKPLTVAGSPFAPADAGGLDLGPLETDTDGLVRLPDVNRLVPAVYDRGGTREAAP
jgi:chemotaxis-related protein WspB